MQTVKAKAEVKISRAAGRGKDDDIAHSMAGTPNDFVKLVCRSLAMASTTETVTCFPTLLLKRPLDLESWRSAGIGTSADWALGYYTNQGFIGDRTRMNLFGYPGLLRDLSHPPPWVEVEPEDVEGNVSAERASELRPLVEHAQEESADALVSLYRSELDSKAFWMKHNFGAARSVEAIESRLESLRERIVLAKVLGSEISYAISDAVFDFDEFTTAEGAPDLFLWLPEPEYSCWFFSEVKGPGDSLRTTQKRWLQEHWDLVRGHYLITVLE